MFSFIIQYLGGSFLGWSLGANDSANVFGTAVTSKMVSYKLAIFLTAIFVILGAILQGEAGIRRYSEGLNKKANIENSSKDGTVTEKSEAEIKADKDKAVRLAVMISFAAAFTVTVMTILKIPVSTSQAAVGAIIGVGLLENNVDWHGLQKVIACWIGTPIGGALFTFILYFLFRKIFRKLKLPIFVYDPVISLLLIVCGCYGAYALGANNVANVTGVFYGAGMMDMSSAKIFGGVTIAIGALTYSKPVMMTVGKGIVKLDAFTAFICVLSHAITVHIFAIIGVPVSTSQAIVGAILGIGLIQGAHIINYKILLKVSAGWIATPFIAGTLSALVYFINHLKFVG